MSSKSPLPHAYHAETPHLSLGQGFFSTVKAASFPTATIRFRHNRWAGEIGLDTLSNEDWQAHFAGFTPLPDNLPDPLALPYHGHQFRQYNPNIGDGRGFLFAQMRDSADRLLDLGTKGSGQTPFSRAGDGRLTLKGGVREVLASQLLEALGVYTSKSLSLIETGEALERQDEPSPARSAVLVRLSHSHIRIGTFQYLAYHQRYDDMMRLINHCVEHYFPHLSSMDQDMRVLAFYGEVITRSANLAASWMAAGFVHGVLNTDNMVITGESFDYGPWRFLPILDPSFTAAYFDHSGLYAYARQPEAVAWNLAQLGGALLPLGDKELLNAALQTYSLAYEKSMAAHFSRRFGVTGLDVSFISAWMAWMAETGAPFEQVLFDWFCGEASLERAEKSPLRTLYKRDDWSPLQAQLLAAPSNEPSRLAHDYFNQSAPCTLLIDQLEEIWAPIAENDDWSRFTAKLEEIKACRNGYGFNPIYNTPT